ncbi:MAG: hypothetical protein SA378_00465 [Sedimentibacter sp.]|uniref:hypothetical protein n=1 Tax=Sedimentibacter sp. TaxID=1960295 RepID=UPI002980E419|nr:hypothetical protein [Sedimentibacter sp.]MDW5298602.1 hypothetical protein [Sedimentibacter sp.]
MSKTNNGNVAGVENRRRCHNCIECDCDCVYECLLELLSDALCSNNPCAGRVNNRCFCVYECLYELLSDALENNCHHPHCPR